MPATGLLCKPNGLFATTAVYLKLDSSNIVGLNAARHLASQNHLIPVVYEQSNTIGGTWVYNDKVGSDDHGIPIHSSMYKSLKTNLPKEVMVCLFLISYGKYLFWMSSLQFLGFSGLSLPGER